MHLILPHDRPKADGELGDVNALDTRRREVAQLVEGHDGGQHPQRRRDTLRPGDVVPRACGPRVRSLNPCPPTTSTRVSAGRRSRLHTSAACSSPEFTVIPIASKKNSM